MLRKDDDWVKKIMSFEVEGRRAQERPRMTWSQGAERAMREYGLKREDSKDRERWRRLMYRVAGQPLRKRGKRP